MQLAPKGTWLQKEACHDLGSEGPKAAEVQVMADGQPCNNLPLTMSDVWAIGTVQTCIAGESLG